jgi:predicted RNA-binding protein with TRAM domain
MGYSGRGGYNRGFNNRNTGPKPVEEGKEYEVEVNSMSDRGDGVAHIQGFVVFVKGGQKGQKTKVKIRSVGPRFAIGEPVQSRDNNNDNPIQGELEQQKNNDNYSTETLGDKQPSEE